MYDWDSLATLRACYGMLIPVPAGAPCSLRHFLLEVLRLTPSYAEERIQTILLDGLVVDGLDTALYPGARLALSAAMPGVVGATLRKGGHYAPMRAGITHTANKSLSTEQNPHGFWVELRCFNDISREVGPALLRKGVALPMDDLTPELRACATALPPHLPPPPCPDIVWACCPSPPFPPLCKEPSHAT